MGLQNLCCILFMKSYLCGEKNEKEMAGACSVHGGFKMRKTNLP
jgi:hypothetical protein